MEVKPIGYSISNNIIPVVRFYHEKSRSDQAILILGRQHPCETVGSFIAEKIINYFTSGQDAITSFLVSSFDIFVIPMINPDGVIHGMSRANMAGLDLNRHWGDNILKVGPS
jgi:murein tripeptide amidase MpaA